jgi:lysozyme
MKINEEGLAIIKYYEGCSLAVYRCPSGIPTIGYGSTFDLDGNRITMDYQNITIDEAEEFLVYGLRTSENAVARLASAPLNANQFSSLVSFCYNVGGGNFQASTLRMKLNRLDYFGAAGEFWKWRRGGGKILRGLVNRRREEYLLFRMRL